MQNRHRLFGSHFETVQHFKIYFSELWFLMVHTYMVQISLQNSSGKLVFLEGVPWNWNRPTPLAPTGVPWSLKCYSGIEFTWTGHKKGCMNVNKILYHLHQPES